LSNVEQFSTIYMRDVIGNLASPFE